MANITRRDFLKIAGVAAGTLAAKDVLAFDFLAPVSTEDALNGNYPYRGWEVFYSEQWVFDHFGRSAHSVNCTGNCTWRAYVKNGIMYKEEQFSDYPDIGSDLPTYNPRGCQKGANHKEYVYGPQRVKYPLIRQGNFQNKASRGQGAFRRASWDEVLKLIANKVVSVIDTEWRDSAGARHKSPDQLFFYAAIPAKHHITLNGGFRLSNLLGAPVGSFYDWYCDNPPGQPMTWAVQTDACESADWYNSTFIMIQGANLLETRIPDSHYFTEARYRGCKTVVVSPEYNATSTHGDIFLAIKPGADGAFCLSMCQVVIAENGHQPAYLKQFTDMPFLVYTSGPFKGKFVRTSQQVDLPPGGGLGPRPNPAFNEYYWFRNGAVEKVPAGLLSQYNPELEVPAGTMHEGAEVKTVFQLLVEFLNADYTPDKVAAISGIAEDTIVAMAREFANNSGFAGTGAARIIEGAATNHYFNNHNINRAQILILALTGNVGYPGTGFDHYVGQEKLWAEDGFFRLAFPNGRPRQRFQPTTLWTYVHAETKSDIDSILPRSIAAYIRESVDSNWMPLWPRGTLDNKRQPKLMFVWGANYLNQAKDYQDLIDNLWPKLDMIVDINFRMDTTAKFSDIILPAASHFEKFDLNTSDLTTWCIPFTPVINTLFQSRTDWTIWRSLAQAIQNTGYRGFTDDFAPFNAFHYPTGQRIDPLVRDFTTLVNQFDTWAAKSPALNPALSYPPVTIPSVKEDRDACQWLLDNSPEFAAHGGMDIKADPFRFDQISDMSALPANSIIKHPQRIREASEEWTSDIIDGVAYYCWQRMTEHLRPLGTQTKRQQFYHDHKWILELDHQLPTAFPTPSVNTVVLNVDDPDRYPLRWNTPHGRWSIHSTWRDAKFQLRLQRGRPIVYLNPVEAAARGLQDNDLVEVFNPHGRVRMHLCISPRVPDRMAIMYHGWERYTLNDGFQSPTTIRINPVQIIGRYGHLNFRLNYWGPTGNQRDTRVQIRFISRVESMDTTGLG